MHDLKLRSQLSLQLYCGELRKLYIMNNYNKKNTINMMTIVVMMSQNTLTL